MTESPQTHRVIDTGGAGFIVSHLVDLLQNECHDFLVIDNFSTGRPENLAHVADHSRLKLNRADMTDHEGILPLF